MASYYKDPDYPSFYWVVIPASNIIKRNAPFWRLVPSLENNKFLVQNFTPRLDDVEKDPAPTWVSMYRNAWIDFMARNTKSLQIPHKPNPALSVIQQLSGLDEEEIRKILSFGD